MKIPFTNFPVSDIAAEVRQKKVYLSSKIKHAQRWKDLRRDGMNIISTWIDDVGNEQSIDLEELAMRCVQEVYDCDFMILYVEEGEHLKGAFIEVGVAVAHGKQIYIIGQALPADSAFTHLKNISFVESIGDAYREHLSFVHVCKAYEMYKAISSDLGLFIRLYNQEIASRKKTKKKRKKKQKW